MIADALKFIQDLAQKAQAPHELPAGPRTKRHVIAGEVVEHALPLPPRDHKVGTLDDLIALANRFAPDVPEPPGDAEEAPPASCEPVVWYGEERVVLVIDDDGHRLERATLDLVVSDVFACLQRLRAKPVKLDQKAFIRLLRLDLAGTLPAGALLEKVRKVKWENGAATTGVVKREQESLGREITSKVTAGGEIPEAVELGVAVYKTVGEAHHRYGLRCAVEVDPEMHEFQLLPLPDEIERVQGLALESIRERLGEALKPNVPAYYGRP